MSWSFQGVGKPAAVKAALAKAVEAYGPASDVNISRLEFERAQPHLAGLIDQVVGDQAVQVDASGHGSWDYSTSPPTQTQGTIAVTVKTLYGFVE